MISLQYLCRVFSIASPDLFSPLHNLHEARPTARPGVRRAYISPFPINHFQITEPSIISPFSERISRSFSHEDSGN
ncbi:unnamed protein product [Periconia digitata]|uniref:Uncharacterized protein n=1 Tax=Periconia digitata TaxID=1303443 RepID=A0A9W4UUI9_9PLEO|nr:unnamed protein product [Periconia digitata]